MTRTELEIRELQRCATIFRILAHPKRIQIVEILQRKPMCVNDIQKLIGLSQAETSHHLHLLLSSGVLINKRDGKNVFYSRDQERLEKVFDALELISH